MELEKLDIFYHDRIGPSLNDDQKRRASELISNSGNDGLKFDFVNVMHQASKQGAEKFDEILDALEKEYKETLSYQHPDIRGRVVDSLLGTNRTQTLLTHLYEEVLHLKKQT